MRGEPEYLAQRRKGAKVRSIGRSGFASLASLLFLCSFAPLREVFAQAQTPAPPPPPPPVLPTWSPVELIESLGVPHGLAEYVVWPAIQFAIILVIVLTAVAYLVYLERKVAAFIQARLGPMRVGPIGLLQPLADGLKLLAKEDLVPAGADRLVFLVAPVIAITAALGLLVLVPFGAGWGTVTDINIGLLFLLAVASVGVFGIVLAGWASNSKYALMGAMRSSAQLVSYEVAVGMALVGPLLFARSLSMQEIVEAQRFTGLWFIVLQPLAFAIYFIGSLAETNRAPFDLPEAESELVAGFHVEYSGFRWAIFFMAEYTNIIITSAIAVTVFLGGWSFPGLEAVVTLIAGTDPSTPFYSVTFTLASFGVFAFKVAVLIYVVMWIRWTLPRYRYDQLMDLGWKWLIPVALANILITALAFLLAMRPDQGGVFGLLEVTKNGLWIGWTGTAFFVAVSAATFAVAAWLLAKLNRTAWTTDIDALRRAEALRRTKRLAIADERGAR